MKIQLTVEFDGTEEECDQIIEDLEDMVAEQVELRLVCDDWSINTWFQDVIEVPATGRPRKEDT